MILWPIVTLPNVTYVCIAHFFDDISGLYVCSLGIVIVIALQICIPITNFFISKCIFGMNLVAYWTFDYIIFGNSCIYRKKKTHTLCAVSMIDSGNSICRHCFSISVRDSNRMIIKIWLIQLFFFRLSWYFVVKKNTNTGKRIGWCESKITHRCIECGFSSDTIKKFMMRFCHKPSSQCYIKKKTHHTLVDAIHTIHSSV